MSSLRATIASAICKSGKFETGQGTCAVICMDHLGCARRSCGHVERVHGKLADQILSDLPGPAQVIEDAFREGFGKGMMAGVCVCADHDSITRDEAWDQSQAKAALAPVAEPCEYCGKGVLTGLPGNACENCMGTGLKYPGRDGERVG